MKTLTRLALVAAIVLGATAARAQTATPTSTNTPVPPTATFTPTNTSTPTATFLAPSTPKATAYAVSPLLSPYTMKRRTSTLAIAASTRILAPKVVDRRLGVYGITVVSDAAAVVTVNVGGFVETFTFVTATVNIPQFRSYPGGLIAPVYTDITATQNGTVGTSITVDYLETRP